MLERTAEAVLEADASEWPQSEARLWPWIGRFLWSPATDLHPSRREALLPGWPAEAWSDPAILAHLSRHLLAAHGFLGEVEAAGLQWHGGCADCLIVLLPQPPLARLARRIGLALHGTAAAAAGPLDEADRAFVEQRAPLYWRAPIAADDPAGTGWQALRALAGGLHAGAARRFEWKTQAGGGAPAALPGGGALLTLARKILKEFEEPWCSLFATLRRPERQIRLSA
jgi:hypothetical protein